MQAAVKPFYVAIAGPTASGKSAFAMQLAQLVGGEIINCDSVQLYKGFDIGSAKPSPSERSACSHHLIDELHWFDEYDASRFARQAELLLEELQRRQVVPVIVGGTGLYLRALWRQDFDDLPKSNELRALFERQSTQELYDRLQALDPVRAAQLHRNDRFRIVRSLEVVELTKKSFPQPETGNAASKSSLLRQQCIAVKLELPRAELHQRIADRTKIMLASGLVDEVRNLLSNGVDPKCKVMQSIGYREVVAMLRGELSAADLQEAITIATRQYAKRQETWFRRVAFDFYVSPHDTSQTIEAIKERLCR